MLKKTVLDYLSKTIWLYVLECAEDHIVGDKIIVT